MCPSAHVLTIPKRLKQSALSGLVLMEKLSSPRANAAQSGSIYTTFQFIGGVLRMCVKSFHKGFNHYQHDPEFQASLPSFLFPWVERQKKHFLLGFRVECKSFKFATCQTIETIKGVSCFGQRRQAIHNCRNKSRSPTIGKEKKRTEKRVEKHLDFSFNFNKQSRILKYPPIYSPPQSYHTQRVITGNIQVQLKIMHIYGDLNPYLERNEKTQLLLEQPMGSF